MTKLVIGASVVAILAAAAFALAPRREVVTDIEIDATPDQVWAVLADPERYPQWNPFIVSMEGELAEGRVLSNTLRSGSGGDMRFQPTILKVEPGRELRWLGRLYLPRILDGEHYFILEERDGGTRLIHGENFRGVLLWFIDANQFRADFERMNQALKERVSGSSPAPSQ